MSVAVVGAGIVGLTTAAHIQTLLPHVQVTVIAEKFNTETTSDGAAGLFFPSPNFTGPTPSSAKDWMVYSYKYYENLLHDDCGVFEISGYSLSSLREKTVQNELMVGVAPEYRPATSEELLQIPGNWKYGSFIKTLLVRCRTLLPWLLKRIESNGGQVVQKTISDLSELAGKYDVVVNCTGIQSKWLCGDDLVAPIRGQILKVKEPSITQFFLADDFDTYIIPNCDGVVSLGGTWQKNEWDLNLRPDDSIDIRARCAQLMPSLKTAPVAWEWVGLRPFRSTVRVESEIRNGQKIIHNYGHGGFGVTSAPGTARDATSLVVKMLQVQP